MNLCIFNSAGEIQAQGLTGETRPRQIAQEWANDAQQTMILAPDAGEGDWWIEEFRPEPESKD